MEPVQEVEVCDDNRVEVQISDHAQVRSSVFIDKIMTCQHTVLGSQLSPRIFAYPSSLRRSSYLLSQLATLDLALAQ
jgi:hypothetical protein